MSIYKLRTEKGIIYINIKNIVSLSLGAKKGMFDTEIGIIINREFFSMGESHDKDKLLKIGKNAKRTVAEISKLMRYFND